MFTGIIQTIGFIQSINIEDQKGRLTISSPKEFGCYEIGESIAVNGVCLTITGFRENSFEVDLSNETLKRTSFGELDVLAKVNLERSLTVNQKISGHFVMGHVDCYAKLVDIQRRTGEVLFWFEYPKNFTSNFIEKGSVAVDGISLTVFDCIEGRFAVSIIPFTLKYTNLHEREIGDKVNIECDMIGKYIYKACESILKLDKNEGRISPNFLKENGFS